MTQASSQVSGAPAPQVSPDLKKVMDTACRALVASGLPEVAERAWSHISTPGGTPEVVVIGEVKRGKSSLVNALLARAASPVDVDIATSAFVRFVPPTDSMPAGATTLLFAGNRRESVDFAALADWVTMSGSHVNDPAIEELPIGAEVALGSPFLPHVTVIDTPGVGGLNPSHLRLAQTATTSASVLLMACDATAPITAPELEFLESVSAEVNSVVIVVTKIDKNFRHWQSIVEENRRLLRMHAPRFADVPILGVSSVAAFSAFKLEAGDRRKSALRASGFSALVQQLHRSCAQGDRLAVANGLRTARSGLERVVAQYELRRSATTGGQGAAAALTEEKERLAALRREWEGGWRDYLARDMGLVQRNTLAVLDHKLDDLKTRWRTKLDATKMDLLRRSPQLFVAEMTADLQVLVGEVSDEYTGAVDALLAGLQFDADVTVSAFTSGVREVERPRKRGEGVIDPSMMSAATTGISTLGMGLVSAVGVGTVVAIPIVAVIGGAWIAVNYGYKAIKMGRQGLQQWLNVTAAAVAKDVSREIQERGDVIRPVIVNEYKRYLTDSIAELKNLLATAEAAEKASRAERADAVAELDAKLTSLRAVIAGVDAELAGLSAPAPATKT
jgi:GTP-binding protein EngB required for normal cell division